MNTPSTSGQCSQLSSSLSRFYGSWLRRLGAAVDDWRGRWSYRNQILKVYFESGHDGVADTFHWTPEHTAHEVDKALRAEWEQDKMDGGPTEKDLHTAEPTDSQIIDLYIQYRDYCAAVDKEAKERKKKYQEAMDTMEALMLGRLTSRGAHNSAGENGSVFLVTPMSVRCEDKGQLMDWCFANPDWGKDLLTANVSKETLELFIQESKDEANPNGYLPPGIKVDRIKTVQFRKAG